MEQDEKFQVVVEMMKRSELDSRTEENLRVFLFSLMKDNGNFDALMEILKNNDSVADIFFRCFNLKFTFFDEGGSVDQWNYILSKEKKLLESLV